MLLLPVVARQHGPARAVAQGPVNGRTTGGPRPDVLARLAAEVKDPAVLRTQSRYARIFGLLLMAVTAAVVIGSAILVGYP